MKYFAAVFSSLILSFAHPNYRPGQTRTVEAVKDQNPKIVVESTEVLIDVVVRDKRDRIVKDLTPADFELYEDGVRQTIASFRLITPDTAEAPAPRKDKAPGDRVPSTKDSPREDTAYEIGTSAIAIVFDRLRAEDRPFATKAALDYLGDTEGLKHYVGVFAIGLSLRPVQNFTLELELVKRGIDKAASLASPSFDASLTRSGMAEDSARREAAIGSAGSAAQSASAAGGGSAIAQGAAAGAADVDRQFEAMQARMQETYEVLQRDEQGYATTNGLLALVDSMRRLPGRKAVIFFSGGLALPPNVQQHFRSVIHAANRANVSVYAVDAAGLRAESPLQTTRDEINARARRRMDNSDRIFYSPDPLTRGLERNEDLLTYNPQSGLSQLASQTGGSFIGDTNNSAPRLRQIDEDLSTYYLLTYSPTNRNYDGRFRNVSVRVNRPGMEVMARKGYYAVPSTGSTPLFYYEALPLAALNNPSKPEDFSLEVCSLNFPEAGRLGRTAVEVEVPAGAFTFSPDNGKKIYGTDFSIVVLIKNPSGRVVDKLSHHYALIGPLNSIDSVRKGKILFYRETDLPPGEYNIEAAAYDALSHKASVNRYRMDIPASDENSLRLSSVAIIRRAEKVREKMDSPFLLGDQVLVYPNLGEPISKSAGKAMGFYFSIYRAKGSSELPSMTLEVLRDNKSIVKVPLKVPAPDPQGRIQYAGGLPLDSLTPGSYELQISVRDGKSTVSRSASFTLER